MNEILRGHGPTVCKHGMLERSCEVCDLTEQLATLAAQPERKEQPIEETVEVPCCGYKASINDHPVKWNPWNKVVQCHNCGQIWEALVKQSDRKPEERSGVGHFYVREGDRVIDRRQTAGTVADRGEP